LQAQWKLENIQSAGDFLNFCLWLSQTRKGTTNHNTSAAVSTWSKEITWFDIMQAQKIQSVRPSDQELDLAHAKKRKRCLGVQVYAKNKMLNHVELAAH
jgi:hypothetical protein